MNHFDISLLVFLSAACVAHYRVTQTKPEHSGIFRALVAVTITNLGTIALYPNRGLIPILLSLAVPGACLYGVCSTHGFQARLSVVVTGFMVLLSWVCSLVEPSAYAWIVLLSWGFLALVSWVCLLDPERTPSGITRLASVTLAASLLADLPGIYVWARYGTWRAESVISSIVVTILATMPFLWNTWTCRQSSSGPSCLASVSSSDVEVDPLPLKSCE